MSILSSMDMPTIDVDLGPEKIENEKEGGPLLHCDLCDTEVVHKLAQMFLPGLCSACVDNTSGDLFKAPGSVAVDLRKEMIEYVTQRSESFVAESVILEGGPDGEVSDHPFDIISNFVDDFVSLKRNLFSRVSGWLLSDKREDKIDDFVQEMEMNGFWTLEKREIIAETLLKNVDFDNSYHCSMSFNSAEDLADHMDNCKFRSMICENEGCNSRFCAAHLDKHDSTCPFKIIQCEQKCSNDIMRRDMDRHCITTCPMKLVNCPFYTVGCRSAVAQCLIEKHRLDYLDSHLWHLLKGIHKKAYGDDLKRRVEQILQASSRSRLAEARDVRSLNIIVKDIESKLGPFEVSVKEKNNAETVAKNGDSEGGDVDMKASESNIKASDNAETVAKNGDSEDGDVDMKASESNIKASDNAETVAKNGDSEGGDVDMKASESNLKASDTVTTSDKVEVSDMMNMNNVGNLAKNEDNEPIHVENKGYEEMNQTSNNSSLSDKSEIDLLNDDNKDVAASELKIKSNEDEDSTQEHMQKLSNEEISATNEDSAENNITGNAYEESKFEHKDNLQSIQDSKMETKDDEEDYVKNNEIENDNLKKSTQTIEE